MRRKIISVLPTLVLVVSLVLVIIPQAKVGAATQNEEFSESDTFVVPETVTKITVQAWGGGGAGGGSTNAGRWSARGGAGGGGGAYASSTLSVTPGQTLQVVAGAGGDGVVGDDGNAGNPSFVGPTTDPDDALARAAGGSGGTGNTDGGSPEGGTGGTVEDSIGQTRIAGGDGEDGATGWWNISSGAGGDGAYGGGSGGAALSSGTSDGNPGDVPGGGGGGARTQRDDGSRVGGAGAAGKVVIIWVTYDLTTSSMEGGSVTTPGEDTFTYGEEFVVDLVATPDEGYRFDEWTGDVSTIADVEAASTTITMNSDYTITAEFVKQYDLTTSSTEGGSITEPGEDTFTYDEGTVVDLIAEVEEDYRFGEWTGDVSTIADVEAASTNITMSGDYSITANFVRQYDLTVSSTEGGSITEPGEDIFTYDEGTVVDLIAEVEEDYRFGEWTGDVSTIADVEDATTNIAMNGDYSITAEFEELLPPPGYPTVTTKAASNTTANSSTLNMDHNVGEFSPVHVRFAYKKSEGLFWSYTNWITQSGNGTYAESINGLSSNTRYDFKAQLNYNDTEIEVEGTTLQFTTDKPSTPSPSGGCFIATAAYGTPTAEQIDVLREFRDVVLLESTAGSQFVALYYQLSPPVADFISGSSFLRTLVRELLVDPIVWVVEATEDIWQN